MAVKEKAIYVVGAMVKSVHVNLEGVKAPVDIRWADGMIGALPVFSSKRKAMKYGKDREILPFTMFL